MEVVLLKFNKSLELETINWLKNNQLNGAFNGQPEEKMDFEKLESEEIEWYYYNWFMEELEFREQ